MSYSFVLFFSVLGYLIATAFIYQSITSNNNATNKLKLAFTVALISVVSHLFYAANVSFLGNELNFSLSSMTSLVSVILVAIYLLGSTTMPIKRLGILVFPLTAISLVFSYLWNSDASYLTNYGGAFTAHILISILAYSLLAITSVQAVLYVYQEKQIKSHASPSVLSALPPLQTMEVLLFRLLATGFILLSLTLISGVLFSQTIFGLPFEFKHHTVLAFMGWGVFAALLFKRFKNGIRGSKAAIWILSGFLLIQLGYFGTKIVSESLNFQ